MFNLFRLPIEKSSLEAWAKVAILATAAILYGEQIQIFKAVNVAALLFFIYGCLITGRIFRQSAEKK